jgi:broad specificity phosphatase PhoE
LRNVEDCEKIKRARGEAKGTFEMKVLLCKLGKKLGCEVDVEESPESELGELMIRHDVLWYVRQPDWYRRLLKIVLSRDDLDREYKKLLENKVKVERQLYAAFEIEGSDTTTKAMKGNISNLSKLPYGIIVVKRGRKERFEEGVEPIRKRFERALLEFRALHGPNNVIVVSFDDVKRLAEELEVQ